MIQNKYIIRFSFVGLFIAIIVQSLLYRYFMIDNIILQEIKKTNNHLAEIYYNQVWNKHKDVTLKLESNIPESLYSDQSFIDFAADSLAFFTNTDLAAIYLHDKTGDDFLASSDTNIKPSDQGVVGLYDELLRKLDKIFLSEEMQNDGLISALSGKSKATIFLNMDLNNHNQVSLNRYLVIYYAPIIVDSKVVGVLELVSDVTDQWAQISVLETKVMRAFLLIFGIFFIIVLYNTSYAQKIINQQFEVNQSLEAARNLAEEESSAKTQFLANVSHELRTPLNAIIGFSEMILSEAYGKIENLQYMEYINDINNSGKHLLGIINDILDFSKASADKLVVDNIELDLNKIVTASMRFVKPRAAKSSVELIEKLPKDHIVITADPKRLKQILLNLLTNAVKFTPADGSVTLEVITNSLEKLVYVKVIDTGIGMSEKDIPKALTSFGQVDNQANRQYEGTGLGLPLTKKLVELINGKFDIQSQVGVGTIVTLTFKYDDSIKI